MLENTNELPQANSDGSAQPAPGAIMEKLPEAKLADLPESMRRGAMLAGWTELMPVQSKAIPYFYAQRDMMIQSRTGSGKTGAYLLPMLDIINPLQLQTQALIMVPTRELAQQVAVEAELLGRAMGVRSIAVYGGVGYREQLDAFKAGAHLVVGTPGRVLDHLMQRSLSLADLKFLVFDEADRMLSMGFYPDMVRVKRYLPKEPISTYMFSATFPGPVLQLTDQFLRSPGFLNLSSDHIHVTETQHVFYKTPGMDKDRSLVRIIEAENPLSALIFCNTKTRVEYVAVVLQRYGYNADMLTSDLSQAAREKVMERVRQGNLRFLVATDVAARGIDLPNLSHVIQYEPPEDPEAYIHRAGRTGRAGASGVAISLVNAIEQRDLMRIGARFSIELQELPLPSEEDVEKIVAERIITLLEGHLRSRDRLQIDRMKRFLPLAQTLAENTDSAGLLAMLLDDFYQETFHAFVVPPDADKKPAAPRSKPDSRRSRGGRRKSGSRS